MIGLLGSWDLAVSEIGERRTDLGRRTPGGDGSVTVGVLVLYTREGIGNTHVPNCQ